VRRSTHLRLRWGFGLATSLLALFAALASVSTSRLLEDGRWVAHTLEVLGTLEGTLSKLFDAEADKRGFLLTGDAMFLRRFDIAVAEAGLKLDSLRRLVADDRAQAERLARLRPLIAGRVAMMREAIEVRRRAGPGGASDLVALGRGVARMDEIRGLVAEMVVVERQLLTDRTGASEFSAQIAYLTYAALLIVVLVLLWAVYRQVRRDFRERADVEEALRQSRERYELAVRGSRDGIWDWDLDAGRIYYSPRWKGMLGHDDGEVSDRFEEFGDRVHPDDRDRATATIAAYLDGRIAEYELEVRLRHKDGTYRWILTRGVALRDDRGRLVQSEKLAGLGQMVAGVAHEINNPLSFVVNNAAILDRDVGDLRGLLAFYEEADPLIAREVPGLAGRIAEFRDRVDMPFLLDNLGKLVKRTDDGLGRIQRVVKDLRLFARLDEGDIKEADLNAGVESTITIIRGNARREDVELVLDLGPIPPVTCYPAKINQVIMNLLSNAVDAVGQGGKVTVRTREEPGSVRIEVADNGPGIDAAIRDRIFDPFFTTKPVGQGTGLGLSISYGIIQEHGGSIEVESEPGKGTTFVVRLPVVPDLASPGEPAPQASARDSGSTGP